MKEIDARGLSCPEPVLLTMGVIQKEKPGRVRVIVDNPASRENVQRYLESQGFTTELSADGPDYLIEGERDGAAVPESKPEPASPRTEGSQKTLVLCATDRLGSGDEELGRKLMANFIRTLKEMGPDLWRLVLLNSGVRLSVAGSPVLDDLRVYEQDGLTILVCGTCLDHYQLLEKKEVGTTTNMLDIVTAMQLADKVITL